jgi:hypothetical protein
MARRYDLSLPVNVRTVAGGKSPSQIGRTRDVSTRGVYLLLERAMSPSTEFDLNMALPGEVAGGLGAVVRALGKVVRVEEWIEDGNPRVGIAAVIRRYEILRIAPSS